MFTSIYDIDVESTNKEYKNIKNIASLERTKPIITRTLTKLEKSLKKIFYDYQDVDNFNPNQWMIYFNKYKKLDNITSLNIELLTDVIYLKVTDPEIINNDNEITKYIVDNLSKDDIDNEILKTKYTIKRYWKILEDFDSR